MGIGSVVRQRRLTLGWSQEELEEQAGLSQTYLSRLELGKIKRPREEVIDRLSAALGLPKRELLRAANVPYEIVEVVAGTRIAVPIIGTIPSDDVDFTAIDEREEPLETVGVVPEDLDGARQPFGLRVLGTYMVALGIFEGDIAILDRADDRPPEDGQLVAVRINDEGASLRRWRQFPEGVALCDGEGRVVRRVTEADDVIVLGFFITYKPGPR